MHQMLDELMAHEYTIPLELIVKCKELIEVEKEQIQRSFCYGYLDYQLNFFEDAEQYYQQTYNK